MALASLSAHESNLRAKLWCKNRGETCAPFSPSLRRPPSSGFFNPRGNGFLRARYLPDATPCDATPDKHDSDTSDRCLLPNTSRLRAPVLVGSRCVPRAYALSGATGFGDPSRGRGRGVITSLLFVLRFGVPRPPLWGISIAQGVLFPVPPTRPTSDALCRFSGSGFRWACVHAFAWALPGGSCQGPADRLPVTDSERKRSESAFPR